MLKLTKAQKSVVDTAIRLEKSIGKGKVFLRYVNDNMRVCFVGHKKGDTCFTVLRDFADDGNEICPIKVNQRILDALAEKRLLIYYDCNHNPGANPNNRATETGYLGARIRTELFEEGVA